MVETVKVILSTTSSKTLEKFSHKPGIIKTTASATKRKERINFSFPHRKKITKLYKESFKEHAAKSIGRTSEVHLLTNSHPEG